MSNYRNRTLIAMGLAAMTGLSQHTGASTVEILSMGDSITFGQGSDTDGLAANASPDGDLGGYRFYLDRLFNTSPLFAGTDYDFVGNRSAGTGIGGSGFADNQHFGVRGAQASQDVAVVGSGNNFGDGDGITIPSMLTGIHNVGPTSSINAAFDTRVANPNAVLLHIGINSLTRDGAGLDGSATDRIATSLNNAVAQFNTLLNGDVGTARTGLVNRLTDTDYFADDAHLFVAMITPRVDGTNTSSTPTAIRQRLPQTVANYNNQVKASLEARMGPAGDLEGRVTFVDLFSIAINELDTQALADEFYSGDLNDLLAAISPYDDSLLNGGGLDYVDWVNSATFDEGFYDEGTYSGDQLVSSTPGANINPNLMPDGLHLSNLGYAITAQVWANAIAAHYVPEPSALVLLAGGGLLAMGRRRRKI